MERTITRKLLECKDRDRRKPLILRGARQVGRTSFPRCHYINFERDDRLGTLFEKDLDPDRILNELQFSLDTSTDRQADLLILDETQHCPKALTALKYFCEQIPQLPLCTAGSLLGMSLAGESFPVGNIALLDLHPMNSEEFLTAIGEARLVELLRSHVFSRALPQTAHEQLWDLRKRHLIVGGLPEVVALYRDMADVAKHSGKTSALHIERLWRNVTHQLAPSQDGSAPKFRFKDAGLGLHRGKLRGPGAPCIRCSGAVLLGRENRGSGVPARIS